MLCRLLRQDRRMGHISSWTLDFCPPTGGLGGWWWWGRGRWSQGTRCKEGAANRLLNNAIMPSRTPIYLFQRLRHQKAKAASPHRLKHWTVLICRFWSRENQTERSMLLYFCSVATVLLVTLLVPHSKTQGTYHTFLSASVAVLCRPRLNETVSR